MALAGMNTLLTNRLSFDVEKPSAFHASQLNVTDNCYVSNILTVGSEPVISFFNKGKSFFGELPFLQFCNKYDICT